jgi:type IV secretion system protein VirB10
VSAKLPEETLQVRGERGATLVNVARSMQSRLSSVLAAGLMIAMGGGALIWYYAHTFSHQREARAASQAGSRVRAQSEMVLPALSPVAFAGPPVAAHQPAPSAPETPLVETLPVAASPEPSPAVATTPVKTPLELARERRLAGAVFAHDSTSPASGDAHIPATSTLAAAAASPQDPHSEWREGANSLTGWLRPSETPAVEARILPTKRLLLPKGAFIDCTLETAIDSTLPGMTTCVTAADTFSADGKVVLLERGTKLVGETRGQVQQGQARVFVLWNEARTPTGVIVPLDSPGTDELGRAGLPGMVEYHFWQRFGAAILISVIDGAVQAGVQSANRSGGSVIYAPSGSQDVLTEVLKGTLSIPPTVVKQNGDRIQVLVARDLDFRPVYELRTASNR